MSNSVFLAGAGSRITAIMAAVLLTSCVPESDYRARVQGGNIDRGRAAIVRYDCGVCHVIPGISAAVGRVGPALDDYSRRPYVAGKFPNEPAMLVSWILDPPSMAPRTAMPALGMSEREARDIAAYLYEPD